MKQWSKARLPLLIGLLLAVGLLGVAIVRGERGTSGAAESIAGEAETQDSARRLEQLLERVEGAGEVRVMLTVSSPDGEASRSGKGGEASSAGGLFSSSRQESASSEVQVEGVAVVCTGAKDWAVRLKITQLVAGLYGIGTNRVCVIN